MQILTSFVALPANNQYLDYSAVDFGRFHYMEAASSTNAGEI